MLSGAGLKHFTLILAAFKRPIVELLLKCRVQQIGLRDWWWGRGYHAVRCGMPARGCSSSTGCQCDSGWHTSCVCMFATASMTLGLSICESFSLSMPGTSGCVGQPFSSWFLAAQRGEWEELALVWLAPRPGTLFHKSSDPQTLPGCSDGSWRLSCGVPMSRHCQTMIVYHQTLKFCYFI